VFTDRGEVQFWGPFKIVENDFWNGSEGVGRDNLEPPVNCASLQLVQTVQRDGDACLRVGRNI